MISRMPYINRWRLMHNIRLENIQELSHQVAALKYFMDHFLDGFELTLDELN